MAAEEGWRIPEVERRLFQGVWTNQALALVEDEIFCGLVTAVAHQRSGWIGNLIVPSPLRGRGYGQRLFRAALELLKRCGVKTACLTASEQGQPLYEKAGLLDEVGARRDVPDAIAVDEHLTKTQKVALLEVYHSFISQETEE